MEEDEIVDLEQEPEVEEVAPEEGDSDPLAWAKEYGGVDKLQDHIRNLERMQSEAHRRNEDARRREEESQRRYEQAQWLESQARYGQGHKPQGRDPWEETTEDGELDLAKALRGLHQKFEEGLRERDRRVEQLELQTIQDNVDRRIRNVASNKKWRDVMAFGGEELVERMTQRAFREGRDLNEIPRLAESWLAEEEGRLREYEKKILARTAQAKERAKGEHIPPSGGRSGKSRPAKPDNLTVDWSKSPKEIEAQRRKVMARLIGDGDG